MVGIRVGSVYNIKHSTGKFYGVCIKKNKKTGTVILRNVVRDEGVELTINIESPRITDIKEIQGYYYNRVRRQLYYIRKKRTKIRWSV